MATLFPWVPESGWPLPLSKPIGWPDGRKTLRNGVEMATFGGTCYVAGYGANPLIQSSCVQLTSSDRQGTYSHISILFNNFCRKSSFPNFQKNRKT